MEPTKVQSEDFKEQVSSVSSPHPPAGIGMHRDSESIDDFEHLDPELSLVKEFQVQGSQKKIDEPLSQEPITDVSHVASAVSQITSEFSDPPVTKLDSIMDAKDIPHLGGGPSSSSSDTVIDSASALLAGDDLFKATILPENMMFSQEPQDLLGFSAEASVKPDTDSLISTHEKLGTKFELEFDVGKLSSQKAFSQAFMDTERENIITEGPSSHKDIPSKLTADVDFQKSGIEPTDVPVLDLDNLSSENYHFDDPFSTLSRDFKKHHDDKDIFDAELNPPKSTIEPEIGTSKSSVSAQDEDDLPSQEEAKPEVEPTPVVAESPHKPLPSAPELIKPVAIVPEPSVKPETIAAVEPNINVLPDKPSIKSASPVCPVKTKPEVDDSDLEEIKPIQLFHYIGFDAWFKPDRLHPKVVELVYWRDPKKSGIVFGSVLGILLSLSYFSLISVVAYLSLVLLTGTISFRIYKNVLQAVQKTSDGHPFKDILELDLTLPQDKVREVTDNAVAHVNAAALELRRLFLVEDLVDSIKFGVLLWCLTYLGSWFNGMTLIIIAFVALFTLPKVYESNKAQIDQNLDIVRSKIADITSKVKAAIPIGKKPVVEEEKKGQ